MNPMFDLLRKRRKIRIKKGKKMNETAFKPEKNISIDDDGLIYTNLIKDPKKQAIIDKIKKVSKELLISPNWLLAVMKKESGLNPKAYNPNGGATGLIQFMPATAKGLKTTTQELANMSFLEQLDYVKMYFLPYKGKIKSYADLYLITFFPAALGKPKDYVFQTKKLSAEKIAKANPAININKDSQITMAEFQEYLYRAFPDNVIDLLT